MNLLLQTVAASLMTGLFCMAAAAALTFGLPRHWLSRLVSFAAGMLLTLALTDLLPEAAAAGLPVARMGTILLLGLLGLFALERTALWHHHQGHRLGDPGTVETRAAAPLLLIGDGCHHFCDGVLLAAAFLTSPVLGWSTALAIAAHEIPRVAGDFALVLEAGWNRPRAFAWSAVTSLATVAGGVLAWYFAQAFHALLPVVLTLAAASFLYIAVSDLMPWLKRQQGHFGWQGGCMAGGVCVAMVGAALAH